MTKVRIRSICLGRAPGVIALALCLSVAATGRTPAAAEVQFRDPLNDQPLEVPDQEVGPAAAQFHESGENPYAGDEQAIAAGKKLYGRWCQACHLPDGTGRIGPSLVDDRWKYERTGTDVGKFEIIYAGGAGAMQAFGQRLSQDEILQLIAFLDSLRRAPVPVNDRPPSRSEAPRQGGAVSASASVQRLDPQAQVRGDLEHRALRDFRP